MNTNVKYLEYIYLLSSLFSVIKHNNMKKTASEARTSTDFNSICRTKNAAASLYKFPLSQDLFCLFFPPPLFLLLMWVSFVYQAEEGVGHA